MAFPLAPFIAGAVVGTVSTLLYRDEKVRENLRSAADSVKSSVDKLTARLMPQAAPEEEAPVPVKRAASKVRTRKAAKTAPAKAAASKSRTTKSAAIKATAAKLTAESPSGESEK